MPYVIRTTRNPEYDIQRNWSAWMGDGYSNEIIALEDVLLLVASMDAQDAFNAQEREDNYEVFLRDLANRYNVDVRYHEVACRWMHVHHDGLSVYALHAQTENEARIEATSHGAHFSGDGQRTIGKVQYLGVVNADKNIHLFFCEDFINE